MDKKESFRSLCSMVFCSLEFRGFLCILFLMAGVPAYSISRRICWLVSVSYFGSDLSSRVGSG